MGLAGAVHAQVQGESGQGGAAAAAPQQPNAIFPGMNTGPVPAADPAANPGNAPGDDPAAIRRSWYIVPRITVAETLTDNVAPASGIKRSDQVTELSPGIRIDSNSARFKFHLDYQLRQLLYAQDSGRRNTQNYLNSFGTLEAVEKWLFVDVSGVVTQQEISPFSFQSASNVTVNPNRIETSNFRVSPYLRGRFADAADYELRYNRSATRSNSSVAVDLDIDEWRGNIKGRTSLTTLDWGVDASHREMDYKGGRNNEEDRYRGLLTYRFDPEFNVSVSAGQESNNFTSADKETHNTHGYGFEWKPSERAQVSGFRERRFFGDGHTFSMAYRSPLSVARFTDSRDVSVLPGRLATVGLGTIHDLLFASTGFTGIADPVERALAVDRTLNLLGIPPNTVVTSGFMTSRVAVERRQALSYALEWTPRDILTLTAVRTEHEGIGVPSGVDIFSVSQNIKQRGFSINYGHRLTPLTTLNMVASQQNSKGTGTNSLTSELKYFQAGVTTRLGPNTSASLAARRSLFDSTTVLPYTENAVIASLTAQF